MAEYMKDRGIKLANPMTEAGRNAASRTTLAGFGAPMGSTEAEKIALFPNEAQQDVSGLYIDES